MASAPLELMCTSPSAGALHGRPGPGLALCGRAQISYVHWQVSKCALAVLGSKFHFHFGYQAVKRLDTATGLSGVAGNRAAASEGSPVTALGAGGDGDFRLRQRRTW